MPYTDEDLSDGGVGTPVESSRRPSRQTGGGGARGGAPGRRRDGDVRPDTPTIDHPAHPLPSVRHGTIDYDRYLEPPSAKFKIFSAERRRQRRRAIAIGVLVAVIVVLIVAWAVVSARQG
jgi:hypothetical protein